jgi:shikimate kinase
MNKWDYGIFEEKLGNTVEYGVVLGNWYSGKSTVCKVMGEDLGYKVIDMKAISAQIKASLGTEEEPFEGEVPLADVEKYVVNHIKKEMNSGNRVRFVFDGFGQKTSEEFIAFTKQFGAPNFIVHLITKEDTIK